MEDKTRVGLALAGGYLLGRTKKAKALVGMALWATGARYRPRDVLRAGAVRAAQSPEFAKLRSEITGPLLMAGRKAAGAVMQAQVERLGDSLRDRTTQLHELSPDADSDADAEKADSSKATDERDQGRAASDSSDTSDSENSPDSDAESDAESSTKSGARPRKAAGRTAPAGRGAPVRASQRPARGSRSTSKTSSSKSASRSSSARQTRRSG